MKIKGLDRMRKELAALQAAVESLNGDIASVSFNPNDPQSIELAIQQMDAAVDEKVASVGRSDMVDKIVRQTKERFREAILERAARARAENGASGEDAS